MGSYSRMQGPPEKELDPTPIEMPVGAMRPRSLQDLVAQMVKSAVEAERGEEFESWEESDDFEEEDPDTLDFSAYELQEIQSEAHIRDFGPDPDPEVPEAQEAPQEDNSGAPDQNEPPMSK